MLYRPTVFAAALGMGLALKLPPFVFQDCHYDIVTVAVSISDGIAAQAFLPEACFEIDFSGTGIKRKHIQFQPMQPQFFSGLLTV